MGNFNDTQHPYLTVKKKEALLKKFEPKALSLTVLQIKTLLIPINPDKRVIFMQTKTLYLWGSISYNQSQFVYNFFTERKDHSKRKEDNETANFGNFLYLLLLLVHTTLF